MKALIAVDGSEGSWEAVRQASSLLAPGRDRIALYYSPPIVRYPRGSEPAPETLERSRAKLADAVFDEACQRLAEGFRPDVQRIVGTRHPRQGILAAADDLRADLIVVGARGVGFIEGLLLGSVSKAVVHGAKTPVLVARPKPTGATRGVSKVILACSDPEHQQRAVELIKQLHWPDQAEGRLMHVLEPMFVGQLPAWLESMARDATTEPLAKAWVQEHDAEKRRMQESLGQTAQELPQAFRSTGPIVVEGCPSEQILRLARTEDMDLIVLGARRLGALDRWLLGSTSEKVLSHAPCSVLIVREHEKS